MNKKKICFIAQFPPPIHGLSKAVETLYHSELSQEFELEKIDITNNKEIVKNFFRIKKSRADLFYFTISQTKGGNLRDLAILKLLSWQGKRCLVHLHGGYYRKLVDEDLPGWQRNANYKAIGRLSGAIVLGESLKPIFKGMLPENKIQIVPNCVDDEFLISDDEFDKKMDEIEKKKIKHILYLSNFICSKGYPEVLFMAKLEKERCERNEEKRFHFHFAGGFFDSAEKQFFFHYIKENHLENYVTYHGVVFGEKKRELLKYCDIFILLSRYPNEGQPISILEAMGNGMVVITTDHAGIPDIVEDGVTGFLCKTKNSDVAYEANSILKDIPYEFIGKNGRKMVFSKYLQFEYISKMRQIFSSCITSNENAKGEGDGST